MAAGAREVLSAAEERFERGRKTTGLFLGPILFLAFLALPLDMDPEQHRLAAVLLLVITLWITEAVPLPIGGLIGASLAVMLQIGEPKDVLAPFGSSTIFTFIGAFIIAQAMLRNGLARRFAFRVLSLPGVAKSSMLTVVAFGVITAVLSAFISNTATVAMLLPTAIAILGTIASATSGEKGGGDDEDEAAAAVREETQARRTNPRFRVALLLMLAYGASVGGLLTPIGSPPNLIGRNAIEEKTGEPIPFFTWFLTALPLCAVMFVILALVLLLLNKPEVKRLTGLEEYVRTERAKLGRLSRAEINTLIAFGVAVVLWILPGVVALVSGGGSPAHERIDSILDEGMVAVIAAALLFVLPVDWRARKPTITWSEASRIDWGTILVFGTGIILGKLLETTGLAATIGKATAPTSSIVAITIFAVLLAIVVSETTSNTAAATVVVPIVIAVAVGAGVDPVIPAMGATFAASFGFMLPVSTPQNAVVYGSGMVPITKMVRSGVSFDVAGALLLIIGVPLMVALTGIGG